MMLRGLPLMLQATEGDGLAFDHFLSEAGVFGRVRSRRRPGLDYRSVFHLKDIEGMERLTQEMLASALD